MKKKTWMLFVAIICGINSFAVANDCVDCSATTEVAQEEKKETAEVATADASAVETQEVAASN